MVSDFIVNSHLVCDKLLWFTGNEAAYTKPIIAQVQ